MLRPEAFPGYISWDTFQANQLRLAENAAGIQWQRGAPREGLALLQGIAICSRCGRLLHVHYTHASAYVCDHATQQYGNARCQTFTTAYIDPAIEALFLQAVEPARLQAALSALDQIEIHRQSRLAHWRQRLERARYDTDLARRRYQRVDPDNRLVAAQLERAWEDSLQQQTTLEKAFLQFQIQQAPPLSEADRQTILNLAADLPARWLHASAADRKRLLRCLIRDVTLDSLSHPGFSRLLVRWHTGATTSLDVPRPRHGTLPLFTWPTACAPSPSTFPTTRSPTASTPIASPPPPACLGPWPVSALSGASTTSPPPVRWARPSLAPAAMACSKRAKPPNA